MAFRKEIIKSVIFEDVVSFNHSSFDDLRGKLWTTFDTSVEEYLLSFRGLHFRHDKFAYSKKNVLRGIHGDFKTWKLVSVVYGEIFQVVVDCRPDSISYLQHETFLINSENPKSVLVPAGFGNAFLVTSDTAVYHYKLAYPGRYNDADAQFLLKWNDPRIGIDWPCRNPLMSKRDG